MTEQLHLYTATVLKDWVDYNGHMNDAAYAIPFSRAVDALMDHIGLSKPERDATHHTVFTLAMQMRFHQEVKEGEPLTVTGQILEVDSKRLRLFQWLRHGREGTLLATCEQLLASIDQSGPKIAPFLPKTAEALDHLLTAHATLPIPAEAGQGITLKRK